jgi:hypothetical protein
MGVVDVTLRPVYPRDGNTVPIEWGAEHDEGCVEKSVKIGVSVT